MSRWEVNLISAFGRGESLALALNNNGFTVRTFDFSGAFPADYRRGGGPFPILTHAGLPEHKSWLAELLPVPRGLSFWLADGPFELGGSMTPFYAANRAAVGSLMGGRPATEFREDWLRRFLLQWASPFHTDSWDVENGVAFPHEQPLGLVPSYREEKAMNFERLRAAGLEVLAFERLIDVQFEGSRLAEMEVGGPQERAFRADHWIWCLSSRETEILDAEVAAGLFPKGIWRPEWSWVCFRAECEAGPWLDGFPEHVVILGDVFLPWVHANATILRLLQPDGFLTWVKVPAKDIGLEDRRRAWAAEIEALLNARLNLARWRVDAASWKLCPHSPVFDRAQADRGAPSYRNFHWIAPETLPRLDFGARLAREAECHSLLEQWRSEQMKKQGAHRDSAVHAP